MREYLFGVTLTCISAAIVRSAVDDSVSKKYIDILCSLCVVCSLVLPVFPLISSIDEYDLEAFFDENALTVMESDSDKIYNDYLRSVSVEQAEFFLESDICDSLNLEEKEVDIRLLSETVDDRVVVTEAVVYLYDSAASKDPAVIKDYIKAKIGVDCQIIY